MIVFKTHSSFRAIKDVDKKHLIHKYFEDVRFFWDEKGKIDSIKLGVGDKKVTISNYEGWWTIDICNRDSNIQLVKREATFTGCLFILVHGFALERV